MNKAFPSTTLDKFLLRLPEGMRDVISAAAKTNKRTMTAEIVLRLQNSLAAEENEQKRLVKKILNTRLTKGKAVEMLDPNDIVGSMEERLKAIEEVINSRLVEMGRPSSHHSPKSSQWITFCCSPDQ